MSTRRLTQLSLFAALIFIAVKFLGIHVGVQFVHLGNALIVIAVLLFGFWEGFLAGAVGLALSDIIGGYAATFWIYTIEALIMCAVVYGLAHFVYKDQMTKGNLLVVALGAAVIKIVMNLLRYTIVGLVASDLPLGPAFALASAKIIGTFGTSLATLIAVPLLYPIFKRLVK